MRSEIRLFAVVLCAVLFGCQSVGRDPLFRLTLHVVDDEGKPLSEAHARVGADRRPKAEESEGKGIFVEGLTDASGNYTGELEAWDASEAGYRVWKDAHYPVWLPYYAKPPVRGKWQPWNPTIEVMLKRIKNPVPMYARLVHGEVPAKDKDVGYDLVAGDWVAPHGKGKIADMILHGTGEVLGDRNYRGELTVVFPGQGNGLISIEVPQPQPSPLRMPYVAPAEGYEAKHVWRSVRKYNLVTMKNEEYINDSSKTRNFFIRVRCEMDTEGKLVKAMYGKIHAPFEFGLRGKDGLPAIAFIYYLNPDGTRNIEFDPNRNLLKPANRDDSSFTGLEP